MGPRRDRVLDVDLQLLVNGLWQAGAEAVAVNGHRLSVLTAIRCRRRRHGELPLADPPVRGVGHRRPRTLAARLTETRGGTWWEDLAANRGLRYDTTAAAHLDLPADPGVVLRYARRGLS